MANLTKKQKIILEEFKIPIEDAFDVSGMTKDEYRVMMKENGYQVAYGCTSCTKCHSSDTLKWRTGRCVLCYPGQKKWIDRHDEYGYVYYAYSKKAQLTKIGSCKNMTERRKTLNTKKTASFNDWVMPTALFCESNAGFIENLVHSELSLYQVIDRNFKDTNSQVSKEVYCISPECAWETILRIGSENGFTQ